MPWGSMNPQKFSRGVRVRSKVDGTPGEGTGDIQVLLPRVSDAGLVLLLHHAQGERAESMLLDPC